MKNTTQIQSFCKGFRDAHNVVKTPNNDLAYKAGYEAGKNTPCFCTICQRRALEKYLEGKPSLVSSQN
jgi:hypothetical protein